MPQLERIQLELTSRCNENCVHCYIPKNNENHDMDTGLLLGILDQCRNMGLKQITFSGGEPMLHPDFLDAIDKADWEGVKIRILSNLVLLDDKIFKMLETCKANILEVQASLYSVDPEVHDAVTKMPGSCELTKKGIERLHRCSIPVFISCPLTKLNKDSYPGVLAFANKFGLGLAPDTVILAQSGGAKNLEYRLDMEEALQVIQSILDNDSAYNAERFLPGYYNAGDALPCVQNTCKNALCVNVKGEVIPQPSWHNVMGDLNKQTLKDIWENSLELKKVQTIGLKDFPKCVFCPDIQFCYMSLEGNANENPQGDPFIIPEHFCAYAKAARTLIHSHHNQYREVS